MDTATSQALAQLGLPGVVILALAVTCRYLFKAFQDSQNARIAEVVENRSAIAANTAALVALTDTLKARR